MSNNNSSEGKKLVKTSLLVIVIITLSKVLGLFKQIIQAAIFGATIETDLINISQEFIRNIDFVICQVIVTSFISIYIKSSHRDENSAKRIIADTSKIISILSIVIISSELLITSSSSF